MTAIRLSHQPFIDAIDEKQEALVKQLPGFRLAGEHQAADLVKNALEHLAAAAIYLHQLNVYQRDAWEGLSLVRVQA